MLNPLILQHAQALTREIAELRSLGFADDELNQTTELLAYRTLARLHGGTPPADQEAETIPTDDIGDPLDE